MASLLWSLNHETWDFGLIRSENLIHVLLFLGRLRDMDNLQWSLPLFSIICPSQGTEGSMSIGFYKVRCAPGRGTYAYFS